MAQGDRYRELAEFIHKRWQDLGRKIRAEVESDQAKTSLIYMPHPFIVPGGRFREVRTIAECTYLCGKFCFRASHHLR